MFPVVLKYPLDQPRLFTIYGSMSKFFEGSTSGLTTKIPPILTFFLDGEPMQSKSLSIYSVI
ncbi:MAG: hypothetical protein PHF26_02490 [Candidatus Gracilibacteria bacterium]|nr:hypothetical protein [Candidatus Gracilibacteria bacterium]